VVDRRSDAALETSFANAPARPWPGPINGQTPDLAFGFSGAA